MASAPGAMEIVSLWRPIYYGMYPQNPFSLKEPSKHSRATEENPGEQQHIWSPDAGHPGQHGDGHRLGPGHQPHLGDGQEVPQVQAPWSTNGNDSCAYFH